MTSHEISLWGIADLQEFTTPQDETGKGFPRAISWTIPMNPAAMLSIQNGPNQTYADEYTSVNHRINELAMELSSKLKKQGYRSQPLAASVRSDPVQLKGDFPQKTAATRAGLGWIGRNCQLVTRPFGPWVRLGTVFTDMELQCDSPMDKAYCGRCMSCVDACPAGALQGNNWYPGIPRKELLDVFACDKWKKENYYQYHNGHNCGICSAVCPYGVKSLKRS
jgi:epoxyqueuosine reductase QueG